MVIIGIPHFFCSALNPIVDWDFRTGIYVYGFPVSNLCSVHPEMVDLSDLSNKFNLWMDTMQVISAKLG
jgi:hypothetical protein